MMERRVAQPARVDNWLWTRSFQGIANLTFVQISNHSILWRGTIFRLQPSSLFPMRPVHYRCPENVLHSTAQCTAADQETINFERPFPLARDCQQESDNPLLSELVAQPERERIAPGNSNIACTSGREWRRVVKLN